MHVLTNVQVTQEIKPKVYNSMKMAGTAMKWRMCMWVCMCAFVSRWVRGGGAFTWAHSID